MGTSERRARERDAKRRAILRCAIRCFAKNGYDRTSLDDVARAAEVAKGTVYLYFKSKADLFASLLLEHGFDPFVRELTARIARCRDARAALRAFAGCFHDLCLAAEREIFELFIQLDRGDIRRDLSEDLRRETRHRLERVLAEIAKVVDAARVGRGVLQPGGRRIALVLWALCVGIAHLAKGGSPLEAGVEPGAVLSDGVECILRGLGPARATRKERKA